MRGRGRARFVQHYVERVAGRLVSDLLPHAQAHARQRACDILLRGAEEKSVVNAWLSRLLADAWSAGPHAEDGRAMQAGRMRTSRIEIVTGGRRRDVDKSAETVRGGQRGCRQPTLEEKTQRTCSRDGFNR
eukprot:3932500-Rhodomonas_salina.4